MELNGGMIPMEIGHDVVSVEPTDDTMLTETREDLEREIQDPEFASCFGADQAKMQLAFTLVDTRDQLKLTQKEVADKLQVSQPYIAKLERGDANPTIGKIGSMLALLGLRLRTQTESLLPQPISSSVVFEGDVAVSLIVTATANAVGAGIKLSGELSGACLYGENTIPVTAGDLTIGGSLYLSEIDIRSPKLIGGTV